MVKVDVSVKYVAEALKVRVMDDGKSSKDVMV